MPIGRPMNSMSIEQLAYIAGIIDGEGSMYFNKSKDGVLLKMGVKNTCKPLLEWLAKATGFEGSLRVLPLRGNRQRCWEWRLTSSQSYRLLKDIARYIVAKQDRVKLVFEYYNLTARERQARGLEFQARMKALHMPAIRMAANAEQAPEVSSLSSGS